jgi:hypothetical protein
MLTYISPVHFSTYWRSSLILSFHLSQGLPSDLFPSRLPTKILYASLICCRDLSKIRNLENTRCPMLTFKSGNQPYMDSSPCVISIQLSIINCLHTLYIHFIGWSRQDATCFGIHIRPFFLFLNTRLYLRPVFSNVISSSENSMFVLFTTLEAKVA